MLEKTCTIWEKKKIIRPMLGSLKKTIINPKIIRLILNIHDCDFQNIKDLVFVYNCNSQNFGKLK